MINWGFEKDDLYLLDTFSTLASPIQQVATLLRSTKKSSPEELLRLCNRLGHPSFT